MKSWLLILVVALAHIGVYAQNDHVLFKTAPPSSFVSEFEFSKWATGTSHGGGRTGKLACGNRIVYWADRMFTSGIPTAEVSIFSKRANGQFDLILFIPMQRAEFRLEIREDQIAIDRYDTGGKKWVQVMRIAPEMIPDEI